MNKWLNGLMDRVFVVMGALIFSQAPHFFQDYTQRLGGHIAELQIQISAVQKVAERSGKSLSEYVQKFMAQSDGDFVAQGEMIQSMLHRFHHLSEAYTSLVNATPLSRPFAFFQHFQLDVAKMTFQEYHLGLTLTTESALYALLGIGFGYSLYRMLRWVLCRGFLLNKV